MKKNEADSTTSVDPAAAAAAAAAKGRVDTAALHKHLYKSIISKYYVKKHSWMSKNLRRFCLTSTGEVLLLSLTTMEITDIWHYESILAVVPDPKNPEDFSIIVRKDTKTDKSEKITFSTSLRSYLLTELLQSIAQTSDEKKNEMKLSEVPMKKVRHNGQTKRVTLTITPWGICQVEHGMIVRTYLFHFLGRILTVSDMPGAFVLEYGKVGKQRYLFEHSPDKLDAFLKQTRSIAEKYICAPILEGKVSIKQVEEEAICCKEVLNPFNTFEEFRMFKVNKVRHVDPSLRLVSLTKNWIVERMSAGDRVVSLHKISYVESIVISANPRNSFTIYYKNGTKGLYICDSDSIRDSFISYLIDCANAIGLRNISVNAVGPDKRFWIMPAGIPADAGTEEQLLTAIASWDTNKRTDEFNIILNKFNENIPYSGPKHINEVSRLENHAIKALETILRTANQSCLNSNTFAAIYRLLIIPIVFDTFIETKSLQAKLISLIKTALNVQNFDVVLLYNMLNVIHLLVAPQMHMKFEEVDDFSSGYDDIKAIERSIADMKKTESDLDHMSQIAASNGSNGISLLLDDSIGADEDSDVNNDLVTLENVLSDSSSSKTELIERISEIKYFKEEGKSMLLEDDILIQLFLTNITTCIYQKSTGLLILGWINILSALIFSDSKKSNPARELAKKSLLDKVGMLGRGFFKLFSHEYCPSIAKNSLLILNLLLQLKDSKMASSLRRNALSEGETLMYFRSFLYPNVTTIKTLITSVVRRQLFRLLVTDCDAALGMIKRIVPPGLSYYLEKSDDQVEGDNLKPDDGQHLVSRNRYKNNTEKKLGYGLEFLSNWNRITRESLNGAKKLLPEELNWIRFYDEFHCDHVKPDLVWNSSTRQELKDALDEELSNFQREQTVAQSNCITWNCAEFTVNYMSVEREVRVGGYYLQLLLDDQKISSIRDPMELYDLLYRRILVERDNELQALCIQAITTIYLCFKDIIGPFKDVDYMVTLLYHCNSYLVRDRIIQLFQAIVSTSMANAFAFTKSKAIPLLVDLLTLVHLGNSRRSTDDEDDIISVDRGTVKEWYYNNRGNTYPHASYGTNGEAGGPLSIGEMKKLYRIGVVTLHTLVWAQGMEEWNTLENVIPLRWALMGSGQRILNDIELCESIIDIFIKLCEAFPTKDSDSTLIRPVSRPKQQLTSAKVLPHLVQLLLARSGLVTNRAAILIDILLSENSQAISQLYRTGFFFFAISQEARHLEYLFDLFKLVKLHHRKQLVRAADVIVSSNDSATSNKCSIYDGILPEGLVCYLDILPPEVYLNVIMGIDQSISTSKIIWDTDMRKTFTRALVKHLGSFPQRLAENPKAVYQYESMDPVPYSRSQSSDTPGYRIDDVFCYHYYINRIESPEDFTLSPSENSSEFIKELDDVLNNIHDYPNAMELRDTVICLQAHVYKKNPRILSTAKFMNYDILAETLNTMKISDPVATAAVMLACIAVQSSDSALDVFDSCGCIEAIVRIFIGLGTQGTTNYSENDKSILMNALHILHLAIEKSKCLAYIEQNSVFIIRIIFKILHISNNEGPAAISNELIKSSLSFMLKLIPSKSTIFEIVSKNFTYELVPLLFRHASNSEDFIGSRSESPNNVIAKLSYDVLRRINQFLSEEKDTYMPPRHLQTKKREHKEMSRIPTRFREQMHSVLIPSIYDKLKVNAQNKFFSELLRMDKNAVLDIVKALGPQEF